MVTRFYMPRNNRNNLHICPYALNNCVCACVSHVLVTARRQIRPVSMGSLIWMPLQFERLCCGIQDTVLPAKSDSDVMFCSQKYQGLRIDRSLVY